MEFTRLKISVCLISSKLRNHFKLYFLHNNSKNTILMKIASNIAKLYQIFFCSCIFHLPYFIVYDIGIVFFKANLFRSKFKFNRFWVLVFFVSMPGNMDHLKKYIMPNFNLFPMKRKTDKKLIENTWYGSENTVSRHLSSLEFIESDVTLFVDVTTMHFTKCTAVVRLFFVSNIFMIKT